MNDPHARLARCPRRGRVSALGLRPDTDRPCGLSVACRRTSDSGRWRPGGTEMMSSIFARFAIALAALPLLLSSPGAHAQKKYGPGASDTEIKVGNTNPYSGPASAYGTIGRAEAAYFAMIND